MSQNVALLDIDETTISDELFEILRSQNITDVYLYTSQAFSPEQLEKINGLKNSLQEKGFSIPKFWSPVDLSLDEISPYVSITSTQIIKTLRALDENIQLKPKAIKDLIKEDGIQTFLNSRLKKFLPIDSTKTKTEQDIELKNKTKEFYQLLTQNMAAEDFSNLLKKILEAQNITPFTNTIKTHLQLNSLRQTLSSLDNSTNKKEKTLQQKGLKLATYADKLLKQKTKLDDENFNDLFQVLQRTNQSINQRNDQKRTRKNVRELAALSEKVSKKTSSIWKKIGATLLTIACAALVVAGVLAAIPSGGSSLLLSTIGGIGLASQIGAGVAVGVSAALGAASLAKGLKTNPVTKFKAALEKFTNSTPRERPKKVRFNDKEEVEILPTTPDENTPESSVPAAETSSLASSSEASANSDVSLITTQDKNTPESSVPAAETSSLASSSEASAFLVVSKFKKAIHQSDIEDSPFDVIPYKAKELALLDWTRLVSLKVTIDGQDIKTLVGKKPLFASNDELETFIKNHLLKNLPESEQATACDKIKLYLHQSSLLHPVSSAALLHNPNPSEPPQYLPTQDDQIRELNFTTTDHGFNIQEITTQTSMVNMEKANTGLDMDQCKIGPDQESEKDYVYKAQATIGIDFVSTPSPDLPFKFTILSNTISYGNEEVKKAFTSKSNPEPTPSEPRGP